MKRFLIGLGLLVPLMLVVLSSLPKREVPPEVKAMFEAAQRCRDLLTGA